MSAQKTQHVEALKAMGVPQDVAQRTVDDAVANGINLGSFLSKFLPAVITVIKDPNVQTILSLLSGLAGQSAPVPSHSK